MNGSTNDSTKGLSEKRGELIEELETLMKRSNEEQRAYTEEETARANKITEEVQAIDETLRQQQEQRAAVLTNATMEKNVEERSYGAVINDFVRGNSAPEFRANETTLGANSSVKMQEFSDDIIKSVQELAGIANEVTTVVATGTYKQILQSDTYKVTGGWVAEKAQFGTAESRWTTKTIDKYKYGSVSVITLEMLNEAAFDVLPEIMGQFGLDFAYGTESGIIAGTGDANGQPTGLLSGGTAKTLASKIAISADDIVNVFHSLKAPYYPNAKWIMNNNTLCAVRKLKDSTGNYLFHQNELSTGYAGTILGKPVLISECMPDIGEGAKPVMFGDFKRGYKAVRNPDITLSLLRELYAGIGAIGVQGILWLGGAPVNNEAYTTVAMAE